MISRLEERIEVAMKMAIGRPKLTTVAEIVEPLARWDEQRLVRASVPRVY
jgi:hypothetical protein